MQKHFCDYGSLLAGVCGLALWGCVWQMAAIKQALDSKVDRDTVRRMLQEREALGPASGSGSASPQ